jgi:hypothetical protein
MKFTFGVVGEENKKSTRKKMPKIRLTLFIICHRYFDTNHFITWFVYFLVCFGDNQLIPGGGEGITLFTQFRPDFFLFSMKQRPEFFSNFGWPDYLFYLQKLPSPPLHPESIQTV